MTKKKEKKVIELVKGKPRPEEERFFAKFSETQLTAVLLLILAATFLVQGIIRYFEHLDKMDYLRPWFILVLLSLVFLVSSVVSITLGGIVSPLKIKRALNLTSFSTFITGFILFLVSVIFLLVIIIFLI